MTIPSVRAFALVNDNNTTQTAQQNTTIPASTVDGDVGLLITWQGTGANTCTTPTGWTLIDGPQRVDSNLSVYAFGRDMLTTDASDALAINWSGGARNGGILAIIQDSDGLAEVVDAYNAQAAGGTSLTMATVTTPEADCAVFHAAVARVATGSAPGLSWPGGYTEDAECDSAYADQNITGSLAHLTGGKATAGSTGGATVTSSASASGAHCYAFAFTSAPPSNAAPVADAGADQTGKATGVTVTLDGTGSTDSDGTITTWSWTQTGGTSVGTITNDDTDTATFVVPSVAADETLTFQLEVTDNLGATDTDTCTVGILLDPPDTDDDGQRIYIVEAGGTALEMAMYINVGGVLVELADEVP